MKQTILSILLMLLPMVASADVVEIDGIWYNLVTKGNVAEVTGNPSMGYFEGSYEGEITIPNKIKSEGVDYSVTKIGDNAFQYSKRLISVIIPNGVTSIGNRAFWSCSALTSVTIPNSVTSIGDFAFAECKYLSSITIPNSVTSIGSYAFSYCSGLTSVTISNSVASIDDYTFVYCSGLTSVTIPNSVTTIGQSAFDNCSSLTSITIPNSVTSIGSSAFAFCTGLTDITISNNLNSIADYTFNGCSVLTSINIPNSVTSIGRFAFKGCCGLLSLTIPKSVTCIDENAFYGCENITDVYCKPEKIRTDIMADMGLYTYTSAFNNSYPEYIILHVPETSIEAYKAVEPWSNFKSIVALPPTCATPVISYANDKISFSCATEGAEFISNIIVSDAKEYYSSEISLSKKYIVSVYATKTGYEASDVATKEIEITSGGNTGPTLAGDVNGDGKVDVADHVALSDIIMAK